MLELTGVVCVRGTASTGCVCASVSPLSEWMVKGVDNPAMESLSSFAPCFHCDNAVIAHILAE